MPQATRLRWSQRLVHVFSALAHRIEHRTDEVQTAVLIDLVCKHMLVKKNRTLITVGGMTLGITTIVFLVSLGYGLQNLVISRVARLEEIKQIQVSSVPGSSAIITEQTIHDITALDSVVDIFPMISVVGRVNYQGSSSDMAVYGVTRQALGQSTTQVVAGELFQSDQLSNIVTSPKTVPLTESQTDDGQLNTNATDQIKKTSHQAKYRLRLPPTHGSAYEKPRLQMAR